MSNLKATVHTNDKGFAVSGYEQIKYGTSLFLSSSSISANVAAKGFQFVDNIFDTEHSRLANIYKPWGRVLLISDATVCGLYSQQWETYFKHHNVSLTVFIMAGGEKNKTMTTMLSIVDAMNEFGLVRKEPVLVVGGG